LALAKISLDQTRAANRGELGTLDVGFFGSTIYRAVPLALKSFRLAHPGIDVSLTRMGKAEQANALLEGRIQVGFGRYYNQVEGITVEPISKEPLYAAIPSSATIAKQSEVSLSDLSRFPLVLFPSGDRPSFADEILNVFRDADVSHEVDCVASDSSSALALVACGARCTIVPEAIADLRFPALKFLPISDCDRTAPTSCMFVTENQSPTLREFLKCIRALSLNSRRDTD